jgi:hypothetical protein
MDAQRLERYEGLAAIGSALVVALITALAVPSFAAGSPSASSSPASVAATPSAARTPALP